MTIETFLDARAGQFAYSKSSNLFGVVDRTDYSAGKDAALLVSMVMQNDPATSNYHISLNRVIFTIGRLDPPEYNRGHSIKIQDREEWELFDSILDIPDQHVVNKVLLMEITNIKQSLALGQTLPGQVNYNPPPIIIPPIFIQNTLNIR